MADPEGTEQRKGVALKFIDLSSKLISGETFLDNTKNYSGSFRPEIIGELNAVTAPGAIPVSLAGKMYSMETVADLSSKSYIWEIKPELESEVDAIRKEAILKSTEEGLFRRVADYENSIMCLANSLLTIADTFSKAENRKSWLDSAKICLEWIKETVRKSLARVFEGLSGLFDKVTTTIDEMIGIIQKKALK